MEDFNLEGKIVSRGAQKTNPTLALGMRKDGAASVWLC
jgi:hypothetical protein